MVLRRPSVRIICPAAGPKGSIHSMDLARLVEERRDDLSPAERRVAEVVIREPEQVAFGTLAEFAARTGASGTTVLRLAAKLGFDGFGTMQTRVQDDLVRQLRPAQRIRDRGSSDPVSQSLALEIENLHATFDSVDRGAFAAAVRKVAECPGRVLVMPAECAVGVGEVIADQLSTLRDGVVLVYGNAVRLGKIIGQVSGRDTVLVFDQRRYDRWLLQALDIVSQGGAYVIAFSDSPLSPLAAIANASFTVSSAGPGPFDSQVTTLALGQALVAAVSEHLAPTAATRLDRAESNWAAMQALSEGGR